MTFCFYDVSELTVSISEYTFYWMISLDPVFLFFEQIVYQTLKWFLFFFWGMMYFERELWQFWLYFFLILNFHTFEFFKWIPQNPYLICSFTFCPGPSNPIEESESWRRKEETVWGIKTSVCLFYSFVKLINEKRNKFYKTSKPFLLISFKQLPLTYFCF